MTTPVLSVSPDVTTYTSNQGLDLQRRLREISAHTRVQETSRLEELRLDFNGYLQPGGRGQNIRFTTPAFEKFCQLLSPGLFTLLDSISGQVRVKDEAASAYSFAEAVQLYNTVLTRRYASRVAGRARFIWNTKDRLLEGVFGARYRYLSNTDIFELADITRTAGRVPLIFHGASLVGRRMLMRYVQRAPQLSVLLPSGVTHHYSGGMYFHNSELGGETSVRMATLLCRSGTEFHAMSSFEGARLNHAGRDFRARVSSTMARLILRLDGARELQRNLSTLARTSLNLTSTNTSSVSIKRLMRYLRALGVTPSAAKAVVHGALYYGSDVNPQRGMESLIEQRVVSSRTLYDLFTALMREAQRFSVNNRELLEQAAYALLLNPTDVG